MSSTNNQYIQVQIEADLLDQAPFTGCFKGPLVDILFPGAWPSPLPSYVWSLE